MTVGAVKYTITEEPLVISKALLDLLLSQDNPDKLISLYIFYYYTAKWQRTNVVKATDSYVAKGLKWGRRTVVKFKKDLIRLGLIEQIIDRDTKGKIKGFYIKVNFIWTRDKVNNLLKNHGENTQCAKNAQWSQCAENPLVDELHTNALNTNNINALSSNNIPREREKSGTQKEEQITDTELKRYVKILYYEGKVKNPDAFLVSTRKALALGDIKPSEIRNKLLRAERSKEIKRLKEKVNKEKNEYFTNYEEINKVLAQSNSKKILDKVKEEVLQEISPYLDLLSEEEKKILREDYSFVLRLRAYKRLKSNELGEKDNTKDAILK